MAGGIDLIISTLCNATLCEYVYDNTEYQLTKKENETLPLMNEINGKHIRVGTYVNRPLSWVETDANGTLIGNGVAFIVLSILRKKFNFTFEIVLPDKNYEIGGARPEESLIGLVNSSKIDMAVAFVPKLIEFRKTAAFSTDLDEGVWRMMLKRPKESAAGSGLLAPFNNLVWYLTLASVLCYGPCITLLTHIRSKFVHDEEHRLPLSPSFWFVYSAFIKQGTSLAPEANTTRVLFATWWLFVILLSAFYTANLTAFLTLSKFTLDIETPQDLYKKNYRWVAPEGGAVQFSVKTPNGELYYLNKMISNGRVEFRSFGNNIEYLPMVRGGAVLVKEQSAIYHLMYADYLKKIQEGVQESDRCTYVVAPKPFMKKPRAFAYPVGSKLKTLFDPTITYIVQAGIIDFLINRNLPSTKICPLDLQSKDRQLRNSDLLMTYLIMVIGLVAAIAVFVGEIFIKRYLHIRFKSDGKSKTRSKKLRKRDESKPPPYESLFGINPKYKVTDKSKRSIINGREYYVLETGHGDTRLIPVRAPSAFLYQ